MSKPSLRHIADEIGISPAYLSYMVNGKRPFNIHRLFLDAMPKEVVCLSRL